ncbi:MAG: hypothetical protein AB7F86_08600 [Bdellovibrionales bacterium]
MAWKLFLFSWILAGSATAAPIWRCEVSGVLAGDIHHFILIGRDSWKAELSALCEDDQKKLRFPIMVTFKSYQQGYGAGQNDLLSILLHFTTAVNPLQVHEVLWVDGTVVAGKVFWFSREPSFDLLATVIPPQSAGAQQSLLKGGLTLTAIASGQTGD